MGEDEEEGKDSSSTAQAILQRIHEQAELKKRRQSQQNNDTSKHKESNQDSEKSSNKKRRKETDCETTESEVERMVPKKRKKLRLSKTKETEYSLSRIELSESVNMTLANISQYELPVDASTPSNADSHKAKIAKTKHVKQKTEEYSEISQVSSDNNATDSSFVESSLNLSKTPKIKKQMRKDFALTERSHMGKDHDELDEIGITKDSDGSDLSSEGDDVDEDDPMDIYMPDDQQTHEDIGGFTVIGQVKSKRKEKVERVLPDWLAKPSVLTADIRTHRVPLHNITGLDQDLINLLKDNGIQDFFPVQGQVIPALLSTFDPHLPQALGRQGTRPCDICCSAPTGSGKTLTYVLPIVQALRRRVVCRVRALVVLPVRDLALQVYKVFSTYCANSPLKVGLLVGQKTLLQEQHQIVRTGSYGSESLVDIIVATPGRLVDHINHTHGFDLSNLRFLVIDEADRMMDEFKHDWLSQVESCVYDDQKRKCPGPLTVASLQAPETPLQKLLFSATLSQNPEKLQQMRLFHPKLYTAVVENAVSPGGSIGMVTDQLLQDDTGGEESVLDKTLDKSGPENADKSLSKNTPVKGDFIGKFTTPAGLTEYFIQSDIAQKPLVILYLLHTLKFRHVLCFTNSVDSTHRLYWLVKLVGDIEVSEFSSRLNPHKRTKLLNKFAAGKIDLLICSDAMARGMDVENVRCVISYETPPYLKTYIHRVGRTARAGRAGTAFTLLEKKQIAYFKRMLSEAGKTGIKEMKVKNSDLKPYVKAYQDALREMPEVLKAEKKRQKLQ